MTTMKLRAHGKINWTLDIKGKRPDGYHEVEMLMQSIGLWDEIVLTPCSQGIYLKSNSSEMPLDETNLAAKAAKLLMDRFDIASGIQIEIQKNIPIVAGLAGGSADAAAVLTGLNVLWNLALSLADLSKLGAKLGADVPFCMIGGTAVARGIGDKLQPLSALKDIWLVLVKPPYGMSTAAAYQGFRLEAVKVNPDWERAYEVLQTGDFQGLQPSLGNVLESVTEARYPEIGTIKKTLIREGAAAALMTGSGPTVFGVFSDVEEAKKAAENLKTQYAQVFTVPTHHTGVEILEGGSL